MQADTTHGSYLMPSLENATVGDAMHPGVLTCEADATAIDVARMMANHHVHCIAVTTGDEQAEEPSWGIISDLDLIRAGVDSPDQLASTMATAPVVNVERTTPLLEAARLMLTHRTPHLLVVDSRTRRPIGILSTLDVAGVLAWGEA
jgi:CBS domain-containing protein